MSKANKQLGEARDVTKAATTQAETNAAQYQDLAKQLFGQQQGVAAKYQPILDQLFQVLQTGGQAGNLAEAVGIQLPEGLSEKSKSALISQAMQGIPSQFGGAKNKLMATMTARGFGGQGGSANLAGQMGNIYSQQELAKSGALSNITLQDEALRNANIQSNRQFNVGTNLAANQAGQNLYGWGLDTMNTMAGIYNPQNYYQLGNQATTQQMAGGQQLGTQLQKNWWDQFGAPLLGAGLNAGVSYLTGGMGGGGSSASKGPYTI